MVRHSPETNKPTNEILFLFHFLIAVDHQTTYVRFYSLERLNFPFKFNTSPPVDETFKLKVFKKSLESAGCIRSSERARRRVSCFPPIFSYRSWICVRKMWDTCFFSHPPPQGNWCRISPPVYYICSTSLCWIFAPQAKISSSTRTFFLIPKNGGRKKQICRKWFFLQTPIFFYKESGQFLLWNSIKIPPICRTAVIHPQVQQHFYLYFIWF